MKPLGEPREAMLARVRDALDGGGVVPAEPPVIDGAVVRTVAVIGDLPALFAERAAAVGMHVQRVTGAAVAATLVALLRQCEGTKAVIGAADSEISQCIDAALAEAGVERLVIGPDAGFEPCFESDVGVSDVAAAIAESGTLVYWCDSVHPRGVCIVPPVHIAIVREEQVLADLVDLHASDRFARDLPASLLYITGPSKTADIEGVLITGVHGPGEVHVLLVGEEAVVGVSRRDAEPRNGRPPLHSP